MFQKVRLCRDCAGMTLVELLVVIVFTAIEVAMILPKFVYSGADNREVALRANLMLLRGAITDFRKDTGVYPASLEDLAAKEAPPAGISSTGTTAPIEAARWRGPYVQVVPKDPINGASFKYSTESGSVGKVYSSAPGYENW